MRRQLHQAAVAVGAARGDAAVEANAFAGQADAAAGALRRRVGRDACLWSDRDHAADAVRLRRLQFDAGAAAAATRIDAPALKHADVAAGDADVAAALTGAAGRVDAAGDRDVAAAAGDDDATRPGSEGARPDDAALVDDEAGRLRGVGEHQRATAIGNDGAGVRCQRLQVAFGDAVTVLPVSPS